MHAALKRCARAQQDSRRRAVAALNAQRQTDQVVFARLNAGEPEALDDADAPFEQDSMDRYAFSPATDGEVVDADGANVVFREVASAIQRQVDVAGNEFVAVPALRRVARLEQYAVTRLQVVAAQLIAV